MNNPDIALSWFWQTAAIFFCVTAVYFAVRRVPWGALRAEPRLQHIFFGAAVLLMLTWSFRAGLSEGLSIHFLGITALTLLFGWDLAILAGLLAVVGLTFMGVEAPAMLAVNLLSLVIIPATVTLLVLRWVERKFDPNFFIYLFLCAFVGGGLTIASSGLSIGLILGLDGMHSWQTIYHEYVQYLPLIMFPEGLINGIIMTALMVLHPDWIRTFDAKRYIDQQ